MAKDDSKKQSRIKAGVRNAGRAMSSAGDELMSDARNDADSRIGAVKFRKGGKVRKSKGRVRSR